MTSIDDLIKKAEEIVFPRASQLKLITNMMKLKKKSPSWMILLSMLEKFLMDEII